MVLDYLVYEVPAKASRPGNSWIATSVLHQLTGSFATDSPRNDGNATFKPRRSWATYSSFHLMSSGRWYRYHHLFADAAGAGWHPNLRRVRELHAASGCLVRGARKCLATH